ncbi:MAG TPA: toll/interleukin-1 receptor domain-containing protein [Thermoanaerobaculia bacterium]|nr:toll/interleukin-1 receptor domain-containing protein [Thermoanaerobaculia bacterium]
MDKVRPSGFWSYARDDDKDLNKALSNLRIRVERRIRVVLGENATVFQDVFDIRTGDDWQQMLRKELNAASFLIPVITPRFLRSRFCRDEVLTFCRIAVERGGQPSLFPIYFIHDREFDSGASDEVVDTLRVYQYFDFRELQFETEERVVDREIHKLAEAIERRLHLTINEGRAMRGSDEVTPAPTTANRSERTWMAGDKAPLRVRFVGFPASVASYLTYGVYREGKIYEVTRFDGNGPSPFQVQDDRGEPFWVTKKAFRVVE